MNRKTFAVLGFILVVALVVGLASVFTVNEGESALIVRLGAPDEVRAWRDGWCERGLGLLRSLGLDARPDRATDPFFGRGGRMLAANQRAQELKLELLVAIAGDEPTAVASFNYHQDHFAGIYDLTLADGGGAHTACLGFGQERIVLALLHAHGVDPASWPADVRRELWV